MPRIAVRGVFYRNGDILLSQHQSHDREWYLIPGGGINQGESVEQAFHRELLEETGYLCSFGEVVMIREVMNIYNDIPILPPGFHQIEIYVAGQIVGQSDAPLAMDKQQIGCCWLPVTELSNLTFYPGELTDCFVRKDWSSIYRGVCL